MKCFNKLKADYAVLLSFISCMFFMGSCNIAYQYDIESGTEDDTADSTNVTIVTGEGIDVSMYESARVFPGLVDTLVDNTVNRLLALDLSKRYNTILTCNKFLVRYTAPGFMPEQVN